MLIFSKLDCKLGKGSNS